ncbi:hypothetical protein KUTeg_003398 [Tegillarca granosa]|uniref:Uncharacterized protein n=1 Tax=Tegillarca granosa TaxID=220873 RepID=A0ABQ9FM08_TEGGR|nr:hypothetical protein KUTeg_003398 [Tegillarca granosa]
MNSVFLFLVFGIFAVYASSDNEAKIAKIRALIKATKAEYEHLKALIEERTYTGDVLSIHTMETEINKSILKQETRNDILT